MTGNARARRALVVVAALVVGVGAVVWFQSRGEDGATLDDYCGPPEVVAGTPSIDEASGSVTVAFESIGGIEGAVAVAELARDDVLIAAKSGELYRGRGGGRPSMVLDLSTDVATESLEQGLLGVAVAPDAAHVYLYATLSDGTARIIEYALDGGDPDVDSRRDVLVLDDPAPTHNGGRIAFGPDGLLWFGIGDGGDGALTNAAQDLGSPFGKLLRFDPKLAGDQAYTIPADNPFVDVEGARGEVWAYGFRNPWGWSVDRATGDLWVGDVGQLCFEEVDHALDGGRGANFGWSFDEGAHEFDGPALGKGGVPDPSIELPDLGDRPVDIVGPVLEYPHQADACSVIGGFVYRGTAIPDLVGTYLYADLCEQAIHTLAPDGDGWIQGQLGGEVPAGIVAFGEGIDGELYVVSLNEGVFRITAA